MNWPSHFAKSWQKYLYEGIYLVLKLSLTQNLKAVETKPRQFDRKRLMVFIVSDEKLWYGYVIIFVIKLSLRYNDKNGNSRNIIYLLLRLKGSFSHNLKPDFHSENSQRNISREVFSRESFSPFNFYSM